MSLPSSPLDLPTIRVTNLFPFPVEGHVVVDEEAYLRLNLHNGPSPWEDPDVLAHLPQGPFDPFLGVHTTADAKWLRANVGEDLVLIKLPLEKRPFQVGDAVRLASNRQVQGVITETDRHGGLKAALPPPTAPQLYAAEDLVLDNRSTTPPMKMPTN
ncbi:hypothetical protein [Nannocystis punicea]|uniref:Uncharacterized protein n=1 Tax=Nannocystis punicea TaxID=2995304 RepID=A0ABY7HC55_9BACT|nr:hypothetical protein [Nannocystis poenicansa]WAS96670.1 hypothetical protein O0S08_11010 [Nannocystis poenicansa]